MEARIISSRLCQVTVAIPVKDRPEDLREAVASVYAQTLKPRELIIVDDASAVPVDAAQLPSTPEGVSLVILRNARSQGGAKSLNRAVGEASCPVIAFLDSDDIFLPDYLEMVARAWSEADASIVCVATGFFWCTNDLIPYRRQFAAAPVTHRALLAGGNIVGGSSVISVRREAFMACGGYPECGGSHDWGLLISLTRNGKLRCLDEPLVLYRSPSTNPKPTYTRSYRKQILAVRTIYLRQPPEDRRIMLPRRKKLLLSHLANMGRRRMALRMALSILRHERGLTREDLRYLLAIALEPRLYHGLLRRYALLRAQLYGRKLLGNRQGRLKHDTPRP